MRLVALCLMVAFTVSACGGKDRWVVKQHKDDMTDEVVINVVQSGKNNKIMLALVCDYEKGSKNPTSASLLAQVPGTRREMEGEDSTWYGYEGNFRYRMNGSEVRYDRIFYNSDNIKNDTTLFYFIYADTPKIVDFVFSPEFKELTLEFTTTRGTIIDTFTGFSASESRKLRDTCAPVVSRSHWKKK